MKRCLVGLVVLLLVSIVLVGCSQSASPTAAPASKAPASPAAEKVINLKFATFIPPQDTYAQSAEAWGKDLEKATNGRIKVTYYHAESLVKMPDLLDATSAGTCDIAMIDASLTPARLPITDILTLPMIFKNASQAAQSFYALYAKYPELRAEYEAAGLRVIWSHNPGPTQLAGKSQMQTLNDLKGLRIACVTPRETASLKLLGATPVTMPMPEHFTAQERGVVDATSNDFNADFIWKIFEITKYRTDNVDITQRDCPIIMNAKTYNNLPTDLKATFDQLTDGLAMSKKVAAAYLDFAAFTRSQIVEYDKKVGNPAIYVLPEDEKAKWLEKVMPVRDQWVSEMKAKNLPGDAMLKDLLAFAAQYK